MLRDREQRRFRVEPERVIIRSGDLVVPPSTVYQVNKGAVALERIGVNGRKAIFSIVRPGNFFGLDAIGSTEHVLTARVLQESEITVLPISKVDPEILRKAIEKEQQQGEELRWLLQQRGPLTSRIAYSLLDLADFSEKVPVVPFTQEVIGQRVGSQREGVSNIIGKLQTRGVVYQVDDAKVKIRDVDALRRAVGLPQYKEMS